MIAFSAISQFFKLPMYFSGLSGSRKETCVEKFLKPKDLKTYNTKSITFLNSSSSCSGAQKICASSCVNPLTLVNPCNSPLCS